MRLKKIRLRGLTRFTSELVLDLTNLPPGIVAVVGENGEGKTTIMEAVAAALYRELPSRGGALRDWSTGRDAFVEVELGYGGADYRLLVQMDREFNGGRGKEEGFIFADGAPLTAGRVTDYDEAVARIFPSKALFLASAFAAQTRVGNFLELDVPARKALFSTLLGNENLQALAERATAHRKPLDAAADRLDTEAARLTEAALAHRLRTEERAALVAGLPALETAAGQARQRLQRAVEARAARKAELEAAAGARAAAVARQAALTTELGDLDWALTRKRAERGTLRDEVASEEAVRARAARLAAALAAKGAATTAWQAATADVRNRDALVAACEGRIRRIDEELDRLTASLEHVKAARLEQPQLQGRCRDLAVARADLQEVADQLAERVAARDAGWGDYAPQERVAQRELDRLTAAVAQAERAAGLISTVPCEGREWVRTVDGVDPRDPACVTSMEGSGCRFLVDATKAAAEVPTLRAQLEAATDERMRVAGLYAGLQVQDAEADQLARTWATAEARVKGLLPAEARLIQVEALLGAAQATEASIGRLQADREREAADLAMLQAQAGTAREGLAATVADGTAASADVEAHKGADVALAAVERAKVALPLVEDAIAAALARHGAATDERAALVIPPEPAAALEAERAAAQAEAEARTASTEADREVRQRREAIAAKDGALAQLGDVEAKRAALEERRTKIAVRRSGWVLLERALGRNGIQALEIDAAGPEVSRLTNQLLEGCYGSRFQVALVTIQEATRGKVAKEIFDIAVHDGLRGGVRTHGGLSGGEKVLVDEALKLALAIFNARRHGAAFETLWRDECDGALSDANAARYPELLREACRLGGFRNLLFVTHRPDVWAQADALIHVGGGKAWVEVL